MNVVVESGNLVRDAEIRAFQSGMEVCTFTIAVNTRVKANGTWEDYANYFDCKMYGDRASKIVGYLKKGSKVTIMGKLKHERWEKDGKKGSKVCIVVNEIDLPPKQKEETVYQDDLPF